MKRQGKNRIEQMLDGTTGNAASFDGVNRAKWKWRDNEACYEFCVTKSDGRQVLWTIHSIVGKNLYDLECPDGRIQPRMKSQDIRKELNSQLRDWFGGETARSASEQKWEELKTLVGSRNAEEGLSRFLRDTGRRTASKDPEQIRNAVLGKAAEYIAGYYGVRLSR